MKRFKILAVIATLVASVVIPTASVAATGNCSVGKLTVYGGANQTGGSRVYCYGVNDADVSSESPTRLVMGPLSNGLFQDDFDITTGRSGISSLAFDTNGTSVACLYYDKNRGGGLLISADHDVVDNLYLQRDNVTESLYIYVANFCPA